MKRKGFILFLSGILQIGMVSAQEINKDVLISENFQKIMGFIFRIENISFIEAIVFSFLFVILLLIVERILSLFIYEDIIRGEKKEFLASLGNQPIIRGAISLIVILILAFFGGIKNISILWTNLGAWIGIPENFLNLWAGFQIILILGIYLGLFFFREISERNSKIGNAVLEGIELGGEDAELELTRR
jgi:hypothetical protein